MRFAQLPGNVGRPRRRAVGWAVMTCFIAGVVSLTWIALTSLRSSTASPESPSTREPSHFSAAGPAAPPVQVCGNAAILRHGPSSPPKGATVIPAGDDSATAIAHNWTIQPRKTYWFAAGRHTLGTSRYSQIIPADGDTFLGAPGAVLDGQHSNLYAFTGRAHGVTIRDLAIKDFGAPGDNFGQGVVNHDAGSGWHIDHISVQHSAGAGVMLGSSDVLTYSCLKDNGEYGFQAMGSHITVDHNEIAGNNTDNWEALQPGCGCSGGAKFWEVNQATVTSNYVHGNLGPGLWADTDNRGFDVAHNYFADNQGEAFIYEISYNLRLADNTFLRNALVDGPKLGGFPDPAVFISESGADSRIPGPYGQSLTITGNIFTDNWSGVVLWENADRFCGSPDNASANMCTLVDPKVVTTKSCNSTNIAKEPYYSDCRWKTQNVLVRGNVFNFAPASIGSDCVSAKYCGFNGIFSQWGGQPSWSPYRGTSVESQIMFRQNNHFSLNTYNGPWKFVVSDQGNAVSWATWQRTPYRQDAGSMMNRGGG